MDVNACLERLIDAAVAGDADELREAANDLALWLERGGFAPTDPRAGLESGNGKSFAENLETIQRFASGDDAA